MAPLGKVPHASAIDLLFRPVEDAVRCLTRIKKMFVGRARTLDSESISNRAGIPRRVFETRREDFRPTCPGALRSWISPQIEGEHCCRVLT